jgi:glucan biosynthesis protein C
MGLLFLISGYFSPQSLDRKEPARFVRDRLIRLDIPLVVFYFVLNSIASLGFDFGEPSMIHITTPLTLQDYPKLVGFEPIWFFSDAAHLRHRLRDLVGCKKRPCATAGAQ